MASFLSWTPPSAGVHPRLYINNGTSGHTVANVRTRVQTQEAAAYSALKSYLASAAGNANTYFAGGRAAEFTAAFAFEYLMSGDTARADKAIIVAMWMASTLGDTTQDHDYRQIMLAIALVYDWCYDRLTSSQRSTLHNSVCQRVATRAATRDNEFFWGTWHGNCIYAHISAIAVLEDPIGSTYSVATKRSWVDTFFDAHDDGSQSSFASVFRHFGNTDGGSSKGSGEFSYFTRNEEFYIRWMPAMERALGIDVWGINPWWPKSINWQIWHSTPDDQMGHCQGDNLGQARFGLDTLWHALQVAQKQPTTTLEQNAAWFAQKIQAINDQPLWGGYWLWRILFGGPIATPAAPTGDLMVFRNSRKIIYKSGWTAGASADDTSVAHGASRFTGDHSHRDAGDVSLNVRGNQIFSQHGHYSSSQSETYKDGSSSTQTGHRFSYYKQAVSKTLLRILHRGELTDTAAKTAAFYHEVDPDTGQAKANEFFGFRPSSGSDQFEQHGGMRWPKDIIDGDWAEQPGDLADFLGSSVWNVETFLGEPINDARFAYWAFDLKSFYWSGKCVRYNLHVCLIKPNQVGTWGRPIIVMWHDLEATLHSSDIDPIRLQFCANMQPGRPVTGDDSFLTFVHATSPEGKAAVKILNPAVFARFVSGFVGGTGIVYPNTTQSVYDFSRFGTVRTEIVPSIVSSTPRLMVVIYPVRASFNELSVPPATFYEDSTKIGIRIRQNASAPEYEVLFSKTSSFGVIFGLVNAAPPPAPPSAPTGLQVTVSPSSITLDWADNPGADDVDRYHVFRAQRDSGGVLGAFTTLASVSGSPPASIYADTTVIAGGVYVYGVSAASGAFESNRTFTSDITAYEPPPPNPVTGLVAVAGDGVVDVDWNDSPELDLESPPYQIYRRTKISDGVYGSFSLLASPATSTHSDGTVVNGTTYQYRVFALNDTGGISNHSTTGDITPMATPPPPEEQRPATDNLARCVGLHHATDTPPYNDVILDEADQAHLAWCYRAFDYQPPPIDYSEGDPIDCTHPDIAGATIDAASPGALDGAAIVGSDTAIDGEEIAHDPA